MAFFDSTGDPFADIRMPGLHLRSFGLHHPPVDRTAIDALPHHWSRGVFFLEGAGYPAAVDRAQPEAGALWVLPPGPGSGCARATPLPSVLIFDFRLTDQTPRTATMCTVQRTELLRAREQLAYLQRLRADGDGPQTCEGAVIILNLLVALLRAAGWLGRAGPVSGLGGDSAMHRLLLTMPLESPLQDVVARSGYQRDHLNRLVKKETGLTLGQFRMQRRLAKAKELLAQGFKIGDVAGEVGFPDQSYFARWFRRQTGLSPTDWLHAQADPSAFEFALCG
jgi:AraC family L-rhamnose operon transcriptional activator RhaR